jgi:hypothetical protein
MTDLLSGPNLVYERGRILGHHLGVAMMAARIYLLVRSAEAQKEVKTPAPKATPR